MFYLMLNIGRSNIRMFAWNVTDTPYLQSPLSEQKWKNKSKGNGWQCVAFSMACGRWGHAFLPLALNLGPEKKGTMSPSSTVHEDQYENKYLVCTRNIRIDGASGICGGGNFRRLSWTSSYQRIDRNTRNRTRRCYNLLDRVFRATFVLILAYS